MDVQYQYLRAMGISAWLPQKICALDFQNTSFSIMLDSPQYFAECLWVCAITDPNLANIPWQKKMFHQHPFVKTIQGMKSVIQTPHITCSVLYVTAHLPFANWGGNDWHNLREHIQGFFPRLVLILGESLSQGLLSSESSIGKLREQTHALAGHIPCRVTFDPNHFTQFPLDKKIAYSDLCDIKKNL